MTKKLRHDLQWWAVVPCKINGRSIFKPLEITYLHCDSSSFGWGIIINDCVEARGFWYKIDQQMHITWKEPKAVRLSVVLFLPRLRGRRVPLNEDNR